MSFISDTEKSQFQAAYKVFFDTFKEDIVIHRRGKVQVVDVNISQLFGYEEPSAYGAGTYQNEPNHTYDIQNETFKGLVIYSSSQGHRNTSDFTYAEEIGANLIDGEIVIKVEEDCRKYLIDAKVERVDVGNKSYKLASKDSQVHKVITGYYFFKLEESK
jgi:hypothetical protein